MHDLGHEAAFDPRAVPEDIKLDWVILKVRKMASLADLENKVKELKLK